MRVFGRWVIVCVSVFCNTSAEFGKTKTPFRSKKTAFYSYKSPIYFDKSSAFLETNAVFLQNDAVFESQSPCFFSSERQPACEKARFYSSNSRTICTKLRFNSLVCSITKIKNGVIICCLLSGFKSVQRKIVCVRPLCTKKPLDTLKYE